MNIVTKEQMFRADEFTINKIGIKEEILMENAGQKMADEIIKIVKKTDRICVFSGVGNNGGDGIVVARRLKNLGFCVDLVIVGDEKKFKKAALSNFLVYKNLGYSYFKYDDLDRKKIDHLFSGYQFFVDAIFGVGFKGELGSVFKDVAEKINDSDAKVISLDVPSGVYANENIPAKDAVVADFTITVSFLKRSMVLYPAKLNYGKIIVVDVDIVLDSSDYEDVAKSWNEEDFVKTFVKKNPNTNKRREGKILLVGGSNNMPGSINLTARACLESGAGLILIATTKEVKSSLTRNILEATYVETLQEGGFLKDFEFVSDLDVVACGPGLGRTPYAKEIVKKVISFDCVVVFDADALYFLDEELLNLVKKRKFPTILTPHTKEMSRICCCEPIEVENSRFSISKDMAKKWNVFLVLKGPNTIVCTPKGEQFVNFSGNEGLAKGGSGDVLTGIVASFAARTKNSIEFAVLNAVYAHGKVADFLLKKDDTQNTITPTKLIDNLKFIL